MIAHYMERRTFLIGGLVAGAAMLGYSLPRPEATAGGGPVVSPTPLKGKGPEAAATPAQTPAATATVKPAETPKPTATVEAKAATTPTVTAKAVAKATAPEGTKDKSAYESKKEVPFSSAHWGPFTASVARQRNTLMAHEPNSWLAYYDFEYKRVNGKASHAQEWEADYVAKISRVALAGWKGWCQGQANAGSLKEKRPTSTAGENFKGTPMQTIRELGLGYLHRADIANPVMRVVNGRKVVATDWVLEQIKKDNYVTVELALPTETGLFYRTAYDVSPDGTHILVTNFGEPPVWAPISTLAWAHVPRHFKPGQDLGKDSKGELNVISSQRLREVDFLRNPEINEDFARGLIYPQTTRRAFLNLLLPHLS